MENKQPLPPINIVFLISKMNNYGGGDGPYVPYAIFDSEDGAYAHIEKKLGREINRDTTRTEYRVAAMPVLNDQIMQQQDAIAKELEDVKARKEELARYEAALEGAVI